MSPNLTPPVKTAVYDFDGSAQSWARTSPTGTVAYDATVDSPHGDGSLKFTTNGSGGACFSDSPIGSAVDMTGKYPIILLRCDDFSRIASVTLQAYDTTSSPLDLYQWTPTNIIKTNGDWIQIALSFSNVVEVQSPTRSPNNRFRFRVIDNGGGEVNVWLGGVFLADEADEGKVVFEFDDGEESVGGTIKTIMDAAGFVGTVPIIPSLVGTTGAVNYTTLAQLQALQASGWDIVGHDVDVLTGKTQAAAEAQIRGVQDYMKANGLRGWPHFVYPGGQHDSTILAAVANTCWSGRAGSERHEPLPLSEKYRQGGLVVLDTTPVSTITTAIDAAIANKDLLRVIFHRVKASPGASTEYATTNFQAVVDHCTNNSITPVNLTSVLGAAGLDPAEVREGMVGSDGNLKPSLVNDTYTGGIASPSQLRPSLVDAAGNLKPSVVYPDGTLRPGARRAT